MEPIPRKRRTRSFIKGSKLMMYSLCTSKAISKPPIPNPDTNEKHVSLGYSVLSQAYITSPGSGAKKDEDCVDTKASNYISSVQERFRQERIGMYGDGDGLDLLDLVSPDSLM